MKLIELEDANIPGKLSDAGKVRADIDGSTNRYLFAMHGGGSIALLAPWIWGTAA